MKTVTIVNHCFHTVKNERENPSKCKCFFISFNLRVRGSDVTKAATNDYVQPINWWIIFSVNSCLVYKMLQNREKCRSVFPKAQVDIFLKKLLKQINRSSKYLAINR